MFHCHDLEKKNEIMNLKPFSIHYMCVSINISVVPHFSRASTLDGETLFFFYFFEKPFKKMVFGVTTYFSLFFLRENKIRNKNPNPTHCLEKTCL